MRNIDLAVHCLLKRKMSKLKMIMILLLVSMTCLTHCSHISNTPCPKTEDVCLTKECVLTAARIHNSIDYDTHPCDDFYQFACGGWRKEHDKTEDAHFVSKYSLLHNKTDRIIKDLLKEEIKVNELSSIKKAKTFYTSCTNKALLEKLGLDPLKKIVNEEFGGWPLATEYWSETHFDLVATMKKLNDYKVASLISLTVTGSNKRYLTIEGPSHRIYPIEDFYLISPPFHSLKDLENDIYKIGSLFGLCDERKAKDEARKLVDFEVQLFNTTSAKWSENSQILTLDELQGKYSQAINWTRLFFSILSSPEVALNDVTGTEEIASFIPDFKKLEDLILKTPKRTIANYLVWRFIDMCLYEDLVAGEVTQYYKYHSYHDNIYKKRYGLDPPRKCLTETTKAFGPVLDRMFVRETFDDESRKILSNMVKRLQSVYNETIENLEWMDDHTKLIAKEKNAFMRSIIGYLPEIDNDTYLESLYSHLTFKKDTYLENMLTIRKESVNKELRELRLPFILDTNSTTFSARSPESIYDVEKNLIVIPAGAVISPIFHKKEPKSLIIGGIGHIFAHEIAHAFDIIGSKFDKFGKRNPWWPYDVSEKFKQKAQCLIDQYGNFTNERYHNINDKGTLGENFADNLAVKQAYKVYRQWTQGLEEPRLPSLPYTHDQLFFISLAQIHCDKSTEKQSRYDSFYDIHEILAESKFRVNGPFQNSEEFAEAFQCPQCSYMNPIDKCNFW